MEASLTAYNAEKLAAEVLERREKELTKRITRYQRKNSILSDIGECDRQMTYSVLDWDKKPLHDWELQARFDVGNLVERETIRELEGLGFKVTLSQLPVQIKNRKGEIIATGKIDGFIEHGGMKFPLEIKSMNVNVFNRIKSVDDLQKQPYLRKYTRQITMYCYGHNQEQGILLLNDCLGHWKIIPIYLDYAEGERILQRLERVHEAIKAKKYPDRIPYDYDQCGKCSFAAICLQDIVNTPADFIENEQLEADLDRHEELKPAAREYDHLHEKLTETFQKIEKAVVGTRFTVVMVPTKRVAYGEIPKEVKAEISETVAKIKKPYEDGVVKTMVVQALEAGK